MLGKQDNNNEMKELVDVMKEISQSLKKIDDNTARLVKKMDFVASYIIEQL